MSLPLLAGLPCAGICWLGLLSLCESLLALLNYFGQRLVRSPPVNRGAWGSCSSIHWSRVEFECEGKAVDWLQPGISPHNSGLPVGRGHSGFEVFILF